MNASALLKTEAIRQSDAILALEGFLPSDLMRKADTAVLSGHMTRAQVANEMRDFIESHKTLTGFLESRTWA
jgi:hypothetical protein